MMAEKNRNLSSIERVKQDAERLKMDVVFKTFDESTRTAQEAAKACQCELGQIVKSLVFEKSDSGELVLILVSGKNNADMTKLETFFDTPLVRATPAKIRDETGFAIGGVAPIGHLSDPATVFDEDLLEYDVIWAAAGRPDSVFKVAPRVLAEKTKSTLLDLKTET